MTPQNEDVHLFWDGMVGPKDDPENQPFLYLFWWVLLDDFYKTISATQFGAFYFFSPILFLFGFIRDEGVFNDTYTWHEICPKWALWNKSISLYQKKLKNILQ